MVKSTRNTKSDNEKRSYNKVIKPYLSEIEKLASEGATNIDIANYLHMSYDRFKYIKERHEELNIILQRARTPIILETRQSLLKRALGYDKEEKRIFRKTDENGKQYTIIEIRTKHVPAEPSCIFTYLRLYDPEWKNHDDRYYEYKDQELQLKKQYLEYEQWYNSN